VVTNPITGFNALNQIGTGSVSFTGDNSGFSGLTTVSAGTLGGITTLGGPVSVLPGGTLAPGLSSTIGTLTLNSDLTLGGNVAVKVNKSLVQSNDLVTVAGALNNTNNGTVSVNNLGAALNAGDKFTLFSQPVTGGSTLAVSGGGVTWSNNLANDGSIIVLSTVAAYSTNISYTVSGSTLTVSWPATHLGWILQSQTNSLSSGLSTNWVDVAGSSAVTSTNLTITKTVPVAFYRLRHP
jgi:autotransporter-associated beta strand protein